MRQAATYFSDEEKERIESAVRDAESRTSAEVVPALATASGRYDRAEDIFGLFLGLAALAVCWALFQGVGASGWGPGQAPTLGLGMVTLVVVVGFVAGATLASYVAWIRRLFTPRGEMRDEVSAQARQTFAAHRVYRTEGGTGLLVYVSLFEQMAAVVADERVVEEIGQAALDEVRDILVAGLREGRACEAYCDAIRLAAGMLEAALPRQADDVNELPDPLVIVEAP